MDDVQLVKIGHCAHQMFEETTSFVLFETTSFDDEVEKFALFDILHNEEEVPCSLYDFVELDDAGMADELEYVNFPGHSLYVCHIDNLLLYQYFNGDPLSSQDVRSHLHLSKRSFTDGRSQLIVADAFLLLGALGHAVITIIKEINLDRTGYVINESKVIRIMVIPA